MRLHCLSEEMEIVFMLHLNKHLYLSNEECNLLVIFWAYEIKGEDTDIWKTIYFLKTVGK